MHWRHVTDNQPIPLLSVVLAIPTFSIFLKLNIFSLVGIFDGIADNPDILPMNGRNFVIFHEQYCDHERPIKIDFLTTKLKCEK